MTPDLPVLVCKDSYLALNEVTGEGNKSSINWSSALQPLETLSSTETFWVWTNTLFFLELWCKLNFF